MLRTYPPELPFLSTLAREVFERFGHDPLLFSDVIIFVPNRRTARSLREAFLDIAPRDALLLPSIRPIGDPEDTPFVLDNQRVLTPLEQQLLLTRLVQAKLPEADAFTLAGSLLQFMEEVEREECDWKNLHKIVPDFYAKHWQETLDFLTIITHHWPAILEEQQAITPMQARIRQIDALTARFSTSPHETPVIIAGTTASQPAVKRLVHAVLALPKGEVILPGYDPNLSEDYVAAMEPTHPQWMMRRLNNALTGGCHPEQPDCSEAEEVGAKDLTKEHTHPDRRSFTPTPLRVGSFRMTECLEDSPLTAFLTQAFRPESLPLTAPIPLNTAPFYRIDCAHPQEEATVIAMIVRKALEHPTHTAMIVTHDRTLALRITHQLLRWDIACDDSAGEPLTRTPEGRFLMLLVTLVAERFAPDALLAVLKHPLMSMDMPRNVIREHTRHLEKLYLRGLRSYRTLNELSDRLACKGEAELSAFIGKLDTALAPLVRVFAYRHMAFSSLVTAHIKAAEALSPNLYRGAIGTQLSHWLESLLAHSDRLAEILPSHYPTLIASMMAQELYRPAYGMHPRITLLSPLEARLHRADCVILAGLNEGSWPGASTPQPWFNRAMRATFGLPPEEQHIGQAAHDFVQLLYAGNVYLTRSRTSEGSPTIPSRWLLKIQAMLDAAGQTDLLNCPTPYLEWASMLDYAQTLSPLAPPAPTPPVSARPTELSVTAIEKLLRNPYGIYAEKILKLKPLDPLNQELDASMFGTIVHEVIHEFLAANTSSDTEEAILELCTLAERAFATLNTHPIVTAFWLPRFERIAHWFVANEAKRRPLFPITHTETQGSYTIDNITLTARADRVDLDQHQQGSIVDYKTGTPPAKKDILLGLASQLVLEALMLEEDGFTFSGKARELAYWHLKGSAAEPATIETHGFTEQDIDLLIAEAKEGLSALIACFNEESTPYRSTPDPEIAPRYNDYAHLARMGEWN